MKIPIVMARIPIFFLTVLVLLSAQTVFAETERKVAVFASERVMGQWIGSYFSKVGSKEIEPNECESDVQAALQDKGIKVMPFEVDQGNLARAQEIRMVFDRYNDLSSIPNDTLLKAARVLGGEVSFAVACNVAFKDIKKRGTSKMFCAEAGCKVVNAKTRLRIATSQEKWCIKAAPVSDARVIMLRDMCRFVGDDLAKKMIQATK